MQWKVRSFINEKPIEEYSKEEVNEFFRKAWDKFFESLGYEPYIDEESEYIDDTKQPGSAREPYSAKTSVTTNE